MNGNADWVSISLKSDFIISQEVVRWLVLRAE